MSFYHVIGTGYDSTRRGDIVDGWFRKPVRDMTATGETGETLRKATGVLHLPFREGCRCHAHGVEYSVCLQSATYLSKT